VDIQSFRLDFARNVEEARSVFAYMRSVANRDSKQLDATKQKISESRALLASLERF